MPIDKSTKCSILFSPNCDEEIHEGVLTILSIEKDAFEDKYLGLPTHLRGGWSKKILIICKLCF
jgi:hypothetical protein